MGDVFIEPLDLSQWRPSRLELLAIEADVPAWALRDYLEAEVARRRAELEELPPAAERSARASRRTSELLR